MFIILGSFDIISALMLLAIAGGTENIPIEFVIFIAAYLIIKGIFFTISGLDFTNLADIIAGATILIAIFITPPVIVLVLLAGYEGIKGISTLAAIL